MLNLKTKDQIDGIKGDYKIVLTLKTAKSIVSNKIGDTYKTIDEAVEYLAKEGINYASGLNSEGKLSIDFIKC